MENTFEITLQYFIKQCQGMINKHFEEKNPQSVPYNLIYTIGPKFVRVISQKKYGENQEINQKCVYCFIEISTGNIIKAQGWKAPQKNGVRGNIYKKNPIDCMDIFGAKYIK
jgi:hypothetical protein